MQKKDIGARAFTLIETIVVMAIIAITTVFATSAWQRTHTAAQATQCLANLRALGVASAQFSADNDGLFPQSTHQGPRYAWQYVLPAYLDGQASRVFKSPLAPNPRQSFSYAINDYLTKSPNGAPQLNYARRQNVDSATQTMLFSLMTKAYGKTDHFHFADPGSGGISPSSVSYQVQTDVTGGRGHYLFVDGHVRAIPWEEIKTEIQRPGSKFIDPTGQY